MKTIYLLLVSLPVFLFSCTTEDEVISPLWGIDFSAENASGFATGSVEQYIGQTKTTYIIKTANLRCSGGDVYSLLYTFESGETMEVKIAKRTIDYYYHYPGTAGSNQLLAVTFDGTGLDLGESKVMIQPRTEENKLATVAKLQTTDKGLFDGAVGRVPLLK
jgi:hypothetical protein